MESETRTNLIVNHLPQNLKNDDFHKLFSEFGTIQNHRVMVDRMTGQSMGYGFVDFENSEQAQKAILRMNNFKIQNKRLKVAFAYAPEESTAAGKNEDRTNVYVANLPTTITAEYLQELFETFGKIEETLIFRDKVTGLPKGVAFIRYSTQEEAESAISQMNNRAIEGRTQALEVRLANNNKKDPKLQEAYNRGYQAAMAKMAAGGARRSFQGPYGIGGMGQNGYSSGSDGGMGDFAGRKMQMDRTNNRFNPMGSMGPSTCAGYSSMSSSSGGYGGNSGGYGGGMSTPTVGPGYGYGSSSSVGMGGSNFAQENFPGMAFGRGMNTPNRPPPKGRSGFMN